MNHKNHRKKTIESYSRQDSGGSFKSYPLEEIKEIQEDQYPSKETNDDKNYLNINVFER